MKRIIILNKKEGETPLEALEKFRAKNKEYKDIKMTYAGRLDPMAFGLLLILAGSLVKKKAKYLALEKEYKFEILFGFATDTYDILGKVISKDNINISNIMRDIIEKISKKFIGKMVQKYPIYSSKTVNGKALFSYARNNKKVKIPEKEVNISSLEFIKLKKINNKKLLENIEKRIKKVKGDFRQEEILRIWQKKLSQKSTFFTACFKIKCSSGTYVRDIANSFGKKMKIPTLAYSIKRTKIGKFVL